MLLAKKLEFAGDQELIKTVKDEIKTLDDVTNKAKGILRKYAMRGGSGEITDKKDEKFMRILFSYHPTRPITDIGRITVG